VAEQRRQGRVSRPGQDGGQTHDVDHSISQAQSKEACAVIAASPLYAETRRR
jgi:hypothetical protein